MIVLLELHPKGGMPDRQRTDLLALRKDSQALTPVVEMLELSMRPPASSAAIA
jgi:hypothetical protein